MQEYSLEHNKKDTFFSSGLQDIFLKFNFDIVTIVLLMKICINVVFKLSNCIIRQLNIWDCGHFQVHECKFCAKWIKTLGKCKEFQISVVGWGKNNYRV